MFKHRYCVYYLCVCLVGGGGGEGGCSITHTPVPCSFEGILFYVSFLCVRVCVVQIFQVCLYSVNVKYVIHLCVCVCVCVCVWFNITGITVQHSCTCSDFLI